MAAQLKRRRSLADFCGQRKLQKTEEAATQRGVEVGRSCTALVAASPAEALFGGGSLCEDIGEKAVEEVDAVELYECEKKDRHKTRLQRPLMAQASDPLPALKSSADIASDLSVKTGLVLTTPHLSFRWLHRLPSVLRGGLSRARSDSHAAVVRDAAVEVCRQCLPSLLSHPEMAAKWLERICQCLAYYEVEGPPLPQTPLGVGLSPQDRAAWDRVAEWDEAFRSCESLLRQGLLPCFLVASDRFSLLVLGEGSPPFEGADGAQRTATKDKPCAVLCKSWAQLREVLAAERVAFKVARHRGTPGAENCTELVPSERLKSSDLDVIRSDLKDLMRSGIQVQTTAELEGFLSSPLSSALWFEGPRMTHKLLDVLRQYFRGSPLPSAPPPPQRLPRLASPAPFACSVARSAQVVRTQSSAAPPATGAVKRTALHRAELRGCFFPNQVQRLLELLRVPLPSFACELTTDPQLSQGVNSFTKLGLCRIEAVQCESAGHGDSAPAAWLWDFRLGS